MSVITADDIRKYSSLNIELNNLLDEQEKYFRDINKENLKDVPDEDKQLIIDFERSVVKKPYDESCQIVNQLIQDINKIFDGKIKSE